MSLDETTTTPQTLDQLCGVLATTVHQCYLALENPASNLLSHHDWIHGGSATPKHGMTIGSRTTWWWLICLTYVVLLIPRRIRIFDHCHGLLSQCNKCRWIGIYHRSLAENGKRWLGPPQTSRPSFRSGATWLPLWPYKRPCLSCRSYCWQLDVCKPYDSPAFNYRWCSKHLKDEMCESNSLHERHSSWCGCTYLFKMPQVSPTATLNEWNGTRCEPCGMPTMVWKQWICTLKMCWGIWLLTLNWLWPQLRLPRSLSAIQPDWLSGHSWERDSILQQHVWRSSLVAAKRFHLWLALHA